MDGFFVAKLRKLANGPKGEVAKPIIAKSSKDKKRKIKSASAAKKHHTKKQKRDQSDS
jgi:hypothetical protein